MARRKTISDEDVLSAAIRAMYAGGPADFTLAGVAAAAGIAPATLIQRFGDKHGLIVAAVAHDNDLFAAALAKLPKGRGAEAVIDVFRVLMAGNDEDVADVSDEGFGEGLLWLHQDMRDPDLNRLCRERFALLRAAIVARLPPLALPPQQAAQLIEAMWNGALIQWGIERKGRLDAYVFNSLKAWFRLAKAKA
ncbi:MAG TPA: TetR/AcrR family transcriptional regulator [Rhizomicrobium sp.]|nr:TetR/AcrR family transcriptional regulator [Rhizomicrobium sp.]